MVQCQGPRSQMVTIEEFVSKTPRIHYRLSSKAPSIHELFLLLLIELVISYNKELKKFICDTRELPTCLSVTFIDYAWSMIQK